MRPSAPDLSVSYKASGSTPSTNVTPPLRLLSIHLPSPLSFLFSLTLIRTPSRIFTTSVGSKHHLPRPHFFTVSQHQQSSQSTFPPSNYRNDSNFAQPLRRWSVHDACARKSQDPQSHRIDSGTLSLLRLHDGDSSDNAIDVNVKLGNVIQQKPQCPYDIIVPPPLSNL